MKKSLTALIILVVLLGTWWFMSDKPSTLPNERPHSPSVPATHTAVPSQSSQTQEVRRQTMVEQLAKLESNTNVPIKFYGKAVDQYGQPVNGAKVRGTVLVYDSLMKNHNEEYFVMTSADGGFSFTGLKGQNLGITMEKKGYQFRSYNSYFHYSKTVSEEEYHNPDSQAPVIFVIWKLSGPEPLVIRNKDIRIPYDGTSVNLDLIVGALIPSGGDVRITLKRTPLQVKRGQQKFDWNIRLEAVDGGFVLIDDQTPYPYEAPEQGYQLILDIDERADDPKWTAYRKMTFYLKSRGGKNHGLVKLDFRTDSERERTGFSFKSFINTSGSRNLEYDPDKQIDK